MADEREACLLRAELLRILERTNTMSRADLVDLVDLNDLNDLNDVIDPIDFVDMLVAVSYSQ